MYLLQYYFWFRHARYHTYFIQVVIFYIMTTFIVLKYQNGIDLLHVKIVIINILLFPFLFPLFRLLKCLKNLF